MGKQKLLNRVWILVAVHGDGEQEPLGAYSSVERAQKGRDAFGDTNTSGYGLSILDPVPLDEIPVVKMEPIS